MTAARVITSFVFLFMFCLNAVAQVNVYTRSLDTARTGANLQETVLTPANVNANTFGKLFTVHTDGQIFTQPLYVSNLAIAGGTHNVVYVGSMRNTIYAIDADTGTVLWSQNFGTPMIAADLENDDNVVRANGGTIGILGTPVIDPDTNYMYFVTGEQPSGTVNFYYNLNAIDITDGSPVHGSPMKISATYQTADLTNPIVFNAERQNARTGLVLANGNVYICFASHEDQDPYYGWVLAYSASTLGQVAVYSDTTLGTTVDGYKYPGGWGGIWMAGQAPAVDGAGNLYLSSGNGSFGKTPNNLVQTGNSFIKLSPQLELLDYFTPYNTATLNNDDGDLGSSGLLLIPDTNYVLGGGKQGVLYLASTGNLGKFNSSSDQVRQEFQAVYGNGTSHIHSGAIYYNSSDKGPSVYVWGENDVLRAFQFNASAGMVSTNPFAQSTMTAPATNNNAAMPGGIISISSNGNNDGILWAATPYAADASKQTTEGVLYAFDATSLKLLWSDKTNAGRDDVGFFAKFVPPVVANGKMYVPNFGANGTTDNSGDLLCYGLLLSQLNVHVANATMTAGSAVPTLTGTVTGLKNGDQVGTTIIVTYSTTATSNSPAGTYPITATVSGSSAGNYNVTVNAGTITVNAAQKPTLTVSANNATRVYNTANPAFNGNVTGAQNGDTFTESFSTPAATTSNVGSYAIVPTASGADINNYNVTTNNGTLTITQASQTIHFPAIASQVYGSAPFAVAATSSAGASYPVTITVQSGPATIAGGTISLTGAGTVVLQAYQAGDANYSAAATATQTFTVTQAPLTVTANNATRVYNTANPTFLGTVTGAQNGDTFTLSFTTTATTTSNVGSYSIVPAVSGANLSNYTVTANNGSLTVTQATQTLNFPAIAARTYGSAPFAVTATSAAGSNYPVSITVQSGPATIAGGTVSIHSAGTVVLLASQAGDTNYSAATATQSFQVTAAQLTVTTNNATRVYDTANPAFSGTVTGAQNGDAFTATFTTIANTASNVGTYPIVPTVSGAQLANYTVSTVNGVLTVTAAPTATTLSAPTTASLGSGVSLSASVASTSGTPGGTLTFYSGTTLLGTGMLNSSGVATFTTTTLPVGLSSLTASYPATGNFAGSTSSASSITVSPSSQTITFSALATRVYGSAPFAVTASSSLGSTYPVTISVQSGPATVSGGIATVTATGTVVLLATQAGDAQHSVATATQAFQVTPAPLSVTAANASRAYGVANPAFTGTVTGAVGNDTFSESFSTTATANSNAGSYPIVPAVSGPLSNYTPTTTNGALTVGAAATTTVISAPSSATSGSSVTLTATIASSAGTPGGSVTFSAGNTSLGAVTLAGGVASLNTTALPTGTDTVTATYIGNGDFAGSSTTASLSVTAAPAPQAGTYTVTASPAALTVKIGKSVNTMLTFTPSGSYSGTIQLSCSGLPANTSCAFAQNSVALSGNNQSATVGLMINATTQSAALQVPGNPGLLALAFYWPGGLTGFAVFARKRRSKMPRLAQLCLLLLCTCAFAAGLSGCGMSGYVATQTTSQVMVVATGTAASGVSTQNVMLSLTVTP